jgi:hypothetical protein
LYPIATAAAMMAMIAEIVALKNPWMKWMNAIARQRMMRIMLRIDISLPPCDFLQDRANYRA